MKKILLIITTSLLLQTTVFAEGNNRFDNNNDSHFQKRNSSIADRLNLTDDQRVKLKEIKISDRNQKKISRKDIKEAREAFHAALKSDLSESEVLVLHDKKQELMMKLANIRLKKILKIRAILTPEQRKKAGNLFFNRSTTNQRYREGKIGNRNKNRENPAKMKLKRKQGFRQVDMKSKQ